MKIINRCGHLLASLLVLLVFSPRALMERNEADHGVGVHTLRADGRTMSIARNGGFRWVVQVVSWREVETWKGQYAWEYPDAVVRAADFYDLDLVFRVDQQPHWASPTTINAPPSSLNDYGDFLYALARRYQGKVKAYIVWNEPNLAIEWGGNRPDPSAYAAMLKLAYGRIKEADPKSIVVSAGLAPTNEQSETAVDDRLYLRQLYQAGIKDSFDVLGAHPYGFAYPPDDPRNAHEGLNFRRVMDLREIMVENGDEEKQMWATEFGWTTRATNSEDAWKVVDEQQQASYLKEAVRLARREWPWMSVMAVWNLSAGLPSHDDTRWYSLIDDDYVPRPSYFALQELSRKVMLRN